MVRAIIFGAIALAVIGFGIWFFSGNEPEKKVTEVEKLPDTNLNEAPQFPSANDNQDIQTGADTNKSDHSGLRLNETPTPATQGGTNTQNTLPQDNGNQNETTPNTTTGAADVDVRVKTYKVQSGDSLWTISKRFYGNGKYYKKIAQANQLSSPNKLRLGQVLVLPNLNKNKNGTGSRIDNETEATQGREESIHELETARATLNQLRNSK